MIKNYFVRFVRDFENKRLYAVINLLVLVIGISSCILIALYISHQSSYDTFHTNSERIYRISSHIKMGKGGGKTPQTPIHLGPLLKREFTFVAEYVRFNPFNFESVTVETQGEIFKETGILGSEQSVFKVFTYNFIVGDINTALKEPGSIVLTESLSRKYFGTKESLGKTIRIDHHDCMVTGVIEDLPGNSDLPIKALIHYDFGNEEDWNDVKYLTFVLTKNTEDKPKLEKSLTQIEKNYVRPFFKQTQFNIEIAFFSTPLEDVHFLKGMIYDTPKGNYIYVYVFLVIGCFILSISSFNYINLSAIQSFNRSKEVGVKGVLGVSKWKIIKEFVFESLALTFISVLLSLILVSVILPLFNDVAQVKITFSSLLHWKTILMVSLTIFILGIISAVIPAFYLTSFSLTKLLKGKLPNFNHGILYRTMLVIQFAMSFIMIIVTVAVYKQIEYMKEKNLGLLMDEVLVIHLPDNMDYTDNLTFKNALLGMTTISMVSIAGDNSIPGSLGIEKNEGFIEGENAQGYMDVFNTIAIDENYLQLLGIPIVAGNNFSSDDNAFNKNGFIVNEAFVKHVGWKDPIGKKIDFLDGGKVIGVARDFNYKSLHSKIEPLIMHYNRGGPNNQLLIKMNSETAFRIIEKKWKAHAGGSPFIFSFLDQSFNGQYKEETSVLTLLFIFSVFVIVLTCLRLFGLSYMITKQRIKEIAIRKVLGGTEINIIYILLKDLLLLIVISVIIATPVAELSISIWQQNFAYQVVIGKALFAWACIVTISITLSTTFYHTFTALRTNPIIGIRQE